MEDPLTHIRKVGIRVRCGVDPDRYRFIAADAEVVRDSLRALGVAEMDLELFNIHESEEVDEGQILLMDVQEIERNFEERMRQWKLPG